MEKTGIGKYCSAALLPAEIVFFLFKISEALLKPTVRLYIIDAVCLNMFSNDTEICSNLSMFPHQEDNVQATAAIYLLCYRLVVNLPTILLALFCGAWSDHVGRKLPIIVSASGMVITCLVLLVSNNIIGLIFLGLAVRGAFGKSTPLTMAVNSHVSDNTTKDSRTRSLGRLLSVKQFGICFGSLLAGLLLITGFFDYVFGLIVVMNSICILITVFFIHNHLPSDRDKVDDPNVHDKTKCMSCQQCRFPCQPSHVCESVNVMTMSRPKSAQCYILFFFLSIFIQQMIKAGEIDITVLYTQQAPLSWSDSMYGYFLAVDYLCLGISSAFLMPCAIKFCKMNDLHLIIIGAGFKLLRVALFAYGSYTWVMFLAVVISSPSIFIIASSRSIISKLVTADEVGKIFSLVSSAEAIAEMTGGVTFTAIYSATVRVFDKSAYIVEAGIIIIWLIMLFIIMCHMKKHENSDVADEAKEVSKYGSTDDAEKKEPLPDNEVKDVEDPKKDDETTQDDAKEDKELTKDEKDDNDNK